MFRSARLKLTAWYLLIIMLISVFFSLAAYQGSIAELRRGMRTQALRGGVLRHGGPLGINRDLRMPPSDPPTPGEPPLSPSDFDTQLFDTQLFEEGSRRIALQLILLNLGILALAGGAGYFLAGHTLRPIEEMVEEQKRFVADASHELRTPLTVMRTEAEVALRDTNLDATGARSVLESALEEIGKLQSLSDYLLTFGRLENVNANQSFARVNLSDIVEEAQRQVGALAQDKNISIGSDVDDVTLEGLRDNLVQLVVILLDNAIKYSSEGDCVNVRGRAQKGGVILEVQDSGAGIRAGDLPFIFNRFYRADASRAKDGAHGYGLGLSIAKSIIDLHNGRVNVRSAPGMGTTFTITLPRS
ncbi:MAG: HAMP domain-containing histidine kinase [Actinobacteria bacterium]|nr:HAMP domain-containing histidine kinase [Actinomycetota bacterium]